MSNLDFAPPLSPNQSTGKLRAILDAAKRAIVRDGVSAISIDAIAADAGVSRQTVYNHLGDKEQLVIAVIRDVTARSSAALMAAIATFPDKPDDLEEALTSFAVRLLDPCMCDIDGRALRWLLERESQRYPELLQAWQAYGPGQDWPVIAGCFARLAGAPSAGGRRKGSPDRRADVPACLRGRSGSNRALIQPGLRHKAAELWPG